MGSGIRKWLLAALAFVGAMALAEAAAAQCGIGCEPPPPPCCEPPPPPPPPPEPCCELPPPPPPQPCCELPPAPPCCGGAGNVNVNIAIAGAGAETSPRSAITARARVGGYHPRGGGSVYVSVDQPYPTVIHGLNVEGAVRERAVRAPYTETRRFQKRVVIQAVCIDDRSVPHPASQVRPDREIPEDYEGELYRCIAGTRLQITIADYLGEVRFDHGDTMACRKGEALWHGRGGFLECRPQKPERDCNERSLLRRYGAGVKILTIYREETYTEYREEVVEEVVGEVVGASIMLDGGVGGRVF